MLFSQFCRSALPLFDKKRTILAVISKKIAQNLCVSLKMSIFGAWFEKEPRH
jgi:hypothetical protein